MPSNQKEVIMNNILIEYMKKRFRANEKELSKGVSKAGPVVTISREYGCPAKRLAGSLVTTLNEIEIENFTKNRWKWIGKEVMEESARELNLKPQIIQDIVQSDEQNVIDEIVLSLSHKYYPGNNKVKKTIRQFIYSIAQQGHVVIVGRGGVAITHDIENALHIKIMAPLEWRIQSVSKRQKISEQAAKKLISDIDKKRLNMRNHFFGRKTDDSVFDIIFNYVRFDDSMIIDTITTIMKSKNMV